MDVHPSKESALLEWINSLHLGEPVERMAQLQDGCLLLKLVYKLKGEEPNQAPVHLPPTERLSIVSDFVFTVCQQCTPLSWDNTSTGKKLDLELAKVVLLLCYYGFINRGMVPSMEYKTWMQIVAMFRYVKDGANSLSLCDGLDKILTMSSLINCPSSSSVSSLSDGSPIFTRSGSSPCVSFLELSTVASSSFVDSPSQEIMNTPQMQLRRLRKELANEGDLRDELERELSEHTIALSEKEGQLSQLQHRLHCLLRDREELEKDHKATLMELQEKNEGLLKRVHEVLKQCKDLKTDNSQKEKRIDELTEENGTLAAQVRSTFAQLASAEEEIAKLTEIHEFSQAEWGSKRDALQKELSQALVDRECLSEKIQILQGKISVLEDELSKVSVQQQEKGEVLGPIVEQEKLKQDLADLTLKHSQLEENISRLKREKLDIELLLSEERLSFEKETLRMERQISDLQEAVNSIRAEREAQEEVSRENQQILTARISSLENDLAHLQQLEVQLTAEIAISAELRKQREKLEAQVASLEDLVNGLQIKCQGMGSENEAQQEALTAVRADLRIAQVSLVEYEMKLADHQKVVEENSSLHTRISALDDTIVLFQNEVERERKRGEEVLVAKDQHTALLEERFQEQEKKAHEMFAELETLSQELRKMKQQKHHAETCMEKFAQEGRALAASLSEQQELAQSQLELVKKAKDESEEELQRIITEHQTKISELHCEIKGNIESLMQRECELCVLKEKASSKDKELVDQQQKLAHLQCEAENLQKQLVEQEGHSQQLSQIVVSKDMEIQQLKADLKMKEGEIQSLKASIQSIQAKSSEMHNLHQREVEDQRLVISELKFQLSDAERLASEKVKALDDLAQHLNSLKEELSIERQKAATMENNFETLKEAHEAQQQSLKLEVAQLQQEINGNLKNLEKFLEEVKSLKQELDCQQNITLEKEKEASILEDKHKALEENFTQLQNKLTEATILAKERQSDLLLLREDMAQQENCRAKAQEIEDIQRKKLEKEVTELQNQVQDLKDIASKKETLLCSLNEKMKEQQEMNQKLLQQSEEALHRELEKTVELTGKLDSATHQVVAKNDVLKSMQEKMKQMALLCQQKETFANEACQAKETLERTVTELCTKQKQELDQYVQKLDTLKNEKEHLFILNQSLQSDRRNMQADLLKMQEDYQQELKEKEEHLQTLQSKCLNLQAENQGQHDAFNTLRTDLQNTLDQHQKEVETLQKEKEHLSLEHHCLQNDYQSLQEKNKEQNETLNLLKGDLQNNQERYQQDLETLMKEKEDLTTVSQSFQNECQSLQAKINEHQDTVSTLKDDLQNTQTEFQKDLRILQEEREHLCSTNQSLQSECQSLLTENKEQQQALDAIKFDLQNTNNQHQKEVETLQKEKEHLSSTCLSLQNECHGLQEKNKEQHEILTTFKVDLQNVQEGHQQELETFQKEREHLFSVNQSLQNEFQSLQAESKGQQDALTALKAHLQNTQEGYQQQLEMLKNEKGHLSSVNQSLQSEFQSLQTEKDSCCLSISALKSDLQNSLDQHQKEIETLQKEKEHLTAVNQSLLEGYEAAQKLSAELGKVKKAAQQREKELENQAEELQVKIKEVLILAAKRESDVENLQQEIRQQEALRMSTQESEKSLRTQLETKVAYLQVQVEKASELSSERKSEMNMLRSEIEECERQKREACQAKEVLERAVTELQIKQKQEQDGYNQELDALKKGKDLMTAINQSLQKKCQSLQEESKVQQEALYDLQNARKELQQEMETLKKENERFFSLNQSLQRECDASQKIGTELEMKLEERIELIHALKEASKEGAKGNQELQEQLKLKSEVVEHYKAQVEKAKIHYSDKKQKLVEEQDARQALQAALEASKSEVNALKAELKLASMELDNVKTSEKGLMTKVKSLEAQVNYADRQLREQKKQADQSAQVRHRESAPQMNVPKEVQNDSTDSLDLDLNDSLNTTSKPSVPGESSTPLVRSSERLAAKLRAQDKGSLETLYFTPMNPRGRKHHDTKHQCKLESSITSLGDLTLDSAKKPASSVKRRYTTQVINITMTKKSPGGGVREADESFYSLHSTQSQPNLASQKTRPVSMEILQQPNTATPSDQLLSLPGYRRSNVHGNPPPRATSTFCVGTENEPDHVPDDWMRIAELQSRNKACLPHLKSSYPLESRPSLGYSCLPITDEDVRTGDPDDTIRRASMIPGQLMDSLSSHRLSLAAPMAPRDHAPSQPQRYSMLPGQISASTAAQRAAQLGRGGVQTREARSARSPLAPKRPAGQLQDSDTPEAKKLASCFPRPATPKGRNLRSTSNNSENIPASSSDRRQSMAFVIDNTPKKSGRGDSRLQRGINKLRSSTRKSPASGIRLARAGTRATNGRSPLVSRPQAKSPRVASTKSPKIPTSTKKLMKFRMKM
ncbi:nuclear mitotic apparatus protein 1 [Electrophorus electricus]|uniref:nuclear mitotic apparatus protein 1 n=1 Tax=Electrophorus electricus TaxID=8005 RepID=UPI0015D0063F|nr:nuclear mitotic apparatus protein 1 [Electrophorus electricus]